MTARPDNSPRGFRQLVATMAIAIALAAVEAAGQMLPEPVPIVMLAPLPQRPFRRRRRKIFRRHRYAEALRC